MSRLLRAPFGALLLGAALAAPGLAVPAAAQSSGQGWFVPKAAAPSAATGHRRAALPPPNAAPPGPDEAASTEGGPQAQPVLPLPPIPPLAEIAKGTPPPTAVIGVLSVPDVMRQSIAAQEVQRVLGARRDKLNQDAQQEQATWRDMQQQIQNAKLSQSQREARERSLQQRVLQAQRDFRNRGRILQEAAQVSLGQVERELVQVIRQVAASRGMNLVLHREQVALNTNEFDITTAVANQLNSTLTSVFIPGDGVDPEQIAKSGVYPTTANPGAPLRAATASASSAPAPAAKH